MSKAIIRLLMIVLAYLLASLVTGYVVYGALLINPTNGTGQDAAAGGPTYGLMIAFFVVLFAAFPASAVISVAEFKAWRMWWYYAVAGSLIGLALGALFSPPHWFRWLGLGFGPVSGLIYWRIAGRYAGLEDRNPRISVGFVMLAATLLLLVSTYSSFLGVIF